MMKNKVFQKFTIYFSVLFFYIIAVIILTRPLIFHLRTHLPCPLNSDGNVFLWNLWHFRWTIFEARTNPFWTDYLYAPFGSNLLLTNYTWLNNILGMFLLLKLGLIGTMNIISILSLALCGYGVYLLCREFVSGFIPAFSAGLLFICSPYFFQLLSDGSFDYLQVVPLVFYIWRCWKAMETKRPKDIWIMAFCFLCVCLAHWYYFVYAILWTFLSIGVDTIHISWKKVIQKQNLTLLWLKRTITFVLFLSFIWLVFNLKKQGQIEFHASGTAKEILVYVMPYLTFWFFFLPRLWFSYPFIPAVQLYLNEENKRKILTALKGLGLGFLLCTPVLVPSFFLVFLGEYAEPVRAWRGGGIVEDFARFFQPNPFNFIWGNFFKKTFGPSYISLGWIALGVWTLGVRRGLFRNRNKLWLIGWILFAIFTLGSYLKLYGFRTYLPLPYWFLYQIPFIRNVRASTRFLPVVLICGAVMWAITLDFLQRNSPRGKFVSILLIGLMLFEFFPGKLKLTRFDVPKAVQKLSVLNTGNVLPIPFGAVFSTVSAFPYFGELNAAHLFFQSVHKKPLVGGYLGRVPSWMDSVHRRDHFLSALVNKNVALLSNSHRVIKGLEDWKIKYILLDRTAVYLEIYNAIEKYWPVKKIYEDNTWCIYQTENK